MNLEAEQAGNIRLSPEYRHGSKSREVGFPRLRLQTRLAARLRPLARAPAGTLWLYALLPDCSAIAQLRSALRAVLQPSFCALSWRMPKQTIFAPLRPRPPAPSPVVSVKIREHSRSAALRKGDSCHPQTAPAPSAKSARHSQFGQLRLGAARSCQPPDFAGRRRTTFSSVANRAASAAAMSAWPKGLASRGRFSTSSLIPV